MKTIDIFLRINCLDHMVFADMFREWKLAQNSMNIWIVIQFLNQCKSSSSSVVSSGSSYESDSIPIYAQAFFLFLTYTLDAGSAPT